MQFPAMRRLSITTGSAFLIVYSVDDESSFEVVQMCMNEIREIRQDFQVSLTQYFIHHRNYFALSASRYWLSWQTKQEIPIVFAGNKCDTPRDERKVLKQTVSEYVHYGLPRLRAKVSST